MADVTIGIPSQLQDCAGRRREISVQAETISDALARLFALYPLLHNHVYERPGVLRPHVWIYYNDTNTKWLDSLDQPLKEGDRITILQAVSGGVT